MSDSLMRRRRFILVFVVLIVAGSAAVAVMVRGKVGASSQSDSLAKPSEVAPEALRTFSTPALEAALRDPETTLAFITSPQTTYKERRAATLRGAGHLPPEFAPRVMYMIGELRDEYVAHGWGLKQHPNDCLPRDFTRSFAQDMKRDRTVLGHAWRVPDQRSDYPMTFEAESAAPWPWQVLECLRDLLIWMTTDTGPWNVSSVAEHTDRWMAACMTMPIDTDREARLFVEATQGGSWIKGKSLPVMSRWLTIALDPSMPEAAQLVARDIGYACRGWDDPRALHVGEVAIARIVAASPHAKARVTAAHGLSALRYNGTYSPPRKEGVEPTLAVFALCERAMDAGLPEWERLYTYVITVCKNLDEPPFEVDYRDVKPDAPESREFLGKFETWYGEHGAELKARADRRRVALESVINSLAGAPSGN